MSVSTIFVTTRRVGFHRWAGAPDEVGFLRSLHRHVFHVKLTMRVGHDDRDLEFFLVQRRLNEILDGHPSCDPGTKELRDAGSCEMLARWVLAQIVDAPQEDLRLRAAVLECEVSEDGENGATLTL